MCNHYYLICSDSNQNKTAFDIYKIRKEELKWPLYTTTRHSDSIKKDDKLLIYLAGNNIYSKHFIAYAEVSKIELIINKEYVDVDLNNAFIKSYLILKNIHKLNKPFNVKENLNNLEFITYKKSYGLYFQGGLRNIDKKTFNHVIFSSK
jgi:hypothetical protein